MSRYQSNRRVQIEPDPAGKVRYDDDDEGSMKLRPSESNVTEDQELFMGVKVRRKASLHRDYLGDYLDVPSHPYLMKILEKQGIFFSELRMNTEFQ